MQARYGDLNLLLLSELANFEEILQDYKRYKELLFKLSPPEWQEAQKNKAWQANVLSDENAPNQQNIEHEESALKQGKYFRIIMREIVRSWATLLT